MADSVNAYDTTNPDVNLSETGKLGISDGYSLVNENIVDDPGNTVSSTDPSLHDKPDGSLGSLDQSDPNNKNKGDSNEKDKDNKRTFDCEFCGWQFTLRGNLLAHLRRHTGEKPFECDLCHRKFTQSSLLTVHTRTHTGEKPFSCDICGRSFSRSGNLNTHRRTHENVKPFQCSYCDKQFSQRVNMDLHTRVHTGVKPYRCGVCNRAFTSCSNMRRHWRQIHPSYPEPALGTMHLTNGLPEKGVYAESGHLYAESDPSGQVSSSVNAADATAAAAMHPMMKSPVYRSDGYSMGDISRLPAHYAAPFQAVPQMLPVVIPSGLPGNEEFDPAIKDEETQATAAAAVVERN